MYYIITGPTYLANYDGMSLLQYNIDDVQCITN